MPTKEYYNVETPDGYRIFEKEFEIAGIQYKKENFIKVMEKGALVKFSLRYESKVHSRKYVLNNQRVRLLELHHFTLAVAARVTA